MPTRATHKMQVIPVRAGHELEHLALHRGRTVMCVPSSGIDDILDTHNRRPQSHGSYITAFGPLGIGFTVSDQS